MTETYEHRNIIKKEFMGETVSFIGSNDRLIERVENFSHESYVIEQLIRNSNPDDVFWDVGACLGIHSFILSQHLPNGNVVSFEPMPTNRGVLMDNKAVNEIENVTVMREALSNESGQVEFDIRESINAGFGRHSISTGEYESVETITVPQEKGDALIKNGVKRPNIIKIDVEGAGPLVLEGLKEYLAKPSCHTVIIETHEPNPVQPSHEDFGYTREEIIEFIEELGFTVSKMENEWHLLGTKNGSPTENNASAKTNIIQGDIASMSADAIVNSAGTSLRMGSGVAGSLREKGGEELNREAISNAPIEAGSAVSTGGHNLDCDYVIHAASMPHHGSGKSTSKSVRNAVRNALEIAEMNDCESVLIPAVGCGLGGLPLATGAEVIGEVIRSFEFDSVEEVTFVGYTDEEIQIIEGVSGL